MANIRYSTDLLKNYREIECCSNCKYSVNVAGGIEIDLDCKRIDEKVWISVEFDYICDFYEKR